MAWLSTYTYRQKIDLSHASGVITNHRMLLTVNKTTGSSSGAVVYLQNHAASWASTVPNDVRFTTSDGSTQLKYWIESSDANTGQVWVKWDSIGTSSTYFYIYYGKASDTTTSSGVDTFILFDNFEDNDVTDWTAFGAASTFAAATDQKYAGSYSGKLTNGAGAGENGYYKTFAAQSACVLEARVRPNASNVSVYGAVLSDGAWSDYKCAYAFFRDTGKIAWYDTAFHDSAVAYSAATWYKWKLICKSLSVYDIVLDAATANADTAFRGSPAHLDRVNIMAYHAGAIEWVDELFIRDYVATEAVWGAWGAEQSSDQFTPSLTTAIGLASTLTKATDLNPDLIEELGLLSILSRDIETTPDIAIPVGLVSTLADSIGISIATPLGILSNLTKTFEASPDFVAPIGLNSVLTKVTELSPDLEEEIGLLASLAYGNEVSIATQVGLGKEIIYTDTEPAADVSVLLLNPDENYGANTFLWLRTIETFPATERSYIKFSLPSQQVQSAKLYLWYESYYAGNPSGYQVDIHRVTQSWAEGTITWNNQPTYGATPIKSFNMPASPGVWLEIDLTDEVNYLIANPSENLGWCIKYNNEAYGSRIDFKMFSKENASNHPYLRTGILELPLSRTIDVSPDLIEEVGFLTSLTKSLDVLPDIKTEIGLISDLTREIEVSPDLITLIGLLTTLTTAAQNILATLTCAVGLAGTLTRAIDTNPEIKVDVGLTSILARINEYNRSLIEEVGLIANLARTIESSLDIKTEVGLNPALIKAIELSPDILAQIGLLGELNHSIEQILTTAIGLITTLTKSIEVTPNILVQVGLLGTLSRATEVTPDLASQVGLVSILIKAIETSPGIIVLLGLNTSLSRDIESSPDVVIAIGVEPFLTRILETNPELKEELGLVASLSRSIDITPDLMEQIGINAILSKAIAVEVLSSIGLINSLSKAIEVTQLNRIGLNPVLTRGIDTSPLIVQQVGLNSILIRDIDTTRLIVIQVGLSSILSISYINNPISTRYRIAPTTIWIGDIAKTGRYGAKE